MRPRYAGGGSCRARSLRASQRRLSGIARRRNGSSTSGVRLTRQSPRQPPGQRSIVERSSAPNPEPSAFTVPRRPCAVPRCAAGISSAAMTADVKSAPSWNIRAAACHTTSAASVRAIAVPAPKSARSPTLASTRRRRPKRSAIGPRTSTPSDPTLTSASAQESSAGAAPRSRPTYESVMTMSDRP